MRRTGYVTTEDWMFHLAGSHNMGYVYAIIYGFSQDGTSSFTGSRKWLADKCFFSVDKVDRILKELVSKGLIVKSVKVINGVKFCSYQAVIPDEVKQNDTGSRKMRPGSAKAMGGVAAKCGIKEYSSRSIDLSEIERSSKTPSKEGSKSDGDAALFGAPDRSTEADLSGFFEEGGVNANPMPGQWIEAECGAGPEEISAAPAKPEKTPSPGPLPQGLTPEAVAEKWNAVCVSLPKVAKLTETRKAHVKKRLAEFGKDSAAQLATVEALFEAVEASDFLCGRSSAWKASFDWLFGSPNNWVKVMEGNYANNTPTAQPQPQPRNPQKRGLTILEAYNAVDDFVARNGGLPGFEPVTAGRAPEPQTEVSGGYLPSGDYIGE